MDAARMTNDFQAASFQKTCDTPIAIGDWLKSSGLPRLEARLILEKVCGLGHAYIAAHGDDALDPTWLPELERLRARRLAGEPMAYLLGSREFFGRPFAVSPAVLIPRPETELLVEWLIQRLPENAAVWDLGTGSGIIAITLKLERPDVRVIASDISTAALAVAQQNAERLDAAVQFTAGDWYAVAAPPASGSLNAVIANPPYIGRHEPELTQGDLRFEPQAALTDFGDGNAALRTLIQGAGQFLRPNALIALEHGYAQGAGVRKMLAQAAFTDIHTHRDYANLERFSTGVWQGEAP